MLFFLILCKLTIMVEAVDYSDCTENIATLEHALYANGANVLQLNQVFYPPGSSPPRHVLLTYQFLNENNEQDGCNVTYVWSRSPWLIFEPPRVFRWTSLHFYYPDNELDELSIILPYECRGLVNNSTLSKNCTCDVENTALLDFLTQQMSVYAQVNNRDNVVREATNARSFCALTLGRNFYEKLINRVVITTIITTIVLPLCGILGVLASFRNIHDTTKSLVKPEGHATLVGMLMTGLVFVVAIFCHDVLASYNIIYGLETYRSQIGFVPTPHFSFVHVMLALDIMFILSIMACLLYIIYSSIKQFLGTEKKIILSPRVMGFMGILIGKKNALNFRRLSDNDVVAFSISYLFIPPLFMGISHVGYIAAAWIVEPNKGAVTFFIMYLLTLYFYLSFKKCYKLLSKIRISVHPPMRTEDVEQSLPSLDGENDDDHNFIAMVVDPSHEETKLKTGADNHKQDADPTVDAQPKEKFCKLCCGKFYVYFDEESDHINIQMFCLLLVGGIFISLFAVMVFSLFVLVPNASESLIIYIINVFHVMVVLVSAQISLKLFFAVNFDLDNFLNVFRNAFSAKKETKANEDVIKVVRSDADTAEVAGVLAAEIADVVINKLPDRKISATANNC